MIFLPAERDGDDSGAILGDLEEHRHSEIEVRPRRVAPSAIVAGLSKVGRAKVGRGDEDGRATRVTPLRITRAFELETSAATVTVVEQSRA